MDPPVYAPVVLICSTCGEENPDRARFCLSCATLLREEKAPVRDARKTITVLFSDLVGSTAMGERLDPESVRQVMTRYFDAMRAVIEDNQGFLEKFIGDAVVARFGIPVVREDDALRAVRAATGMRDALATLNEELESRWGVRLNVRMGVNTGEVVAGHPQADQSVILGDAINTAARFEQAAPPGEILIGESTYRLVRHAVVAEPVERLSLKGKAEAVPAYRLIAVHADAEAIPRRLGSPMVGREQELQVLRVALEQATRTHAGQMVTVLGPAGVGKSRLTVEFLAEARSKATVLSARCHPYGGGSPFSPLDEAIRKAAAIGDEDSPGEAAAKIASIVGDLEQGSRVAEQLNAVVGLEEPRGSSESLFWAVRRFLEALATARPVVLSVDDVHWAEPMVLDLLDDISRWTRAPLLVVRTARPELEEIQPAQSEDRPGASTILLEPLGTSETQGLLDNLLDGGEIPGTAVSRIAEAAEGNPLHLEEIVQMLIDQGALVRREEGWSLGTELSELTVPPTVQAIVESRLDHMPAEERQVLERAAVIGRAFSTSALDSLDPGDPAGTATHLRALQRKDFIRPETSLDGEVFRFRHAVVLDTVYRGIPKALRADLHERYASWFEQRPEVPDTERSSSIGHHLERSVRFRRELGTVDDHVRELAGKAIRHLVALGNRALAIGDRLAAGEVNDRVQVLVTELGTQGADAEIVAQVGRLMIALGDWERIVRLLSPHADRKDPSVLRDLGVALCKLNRANTGGEAYRQGQRYLEAAIAGPRPDIDAVASLAGTWKGVDEKTARDLYGRAVQLDRSDPYALGNWLDYEIEAQGDLSVVREHEEKIHAAIARCREQADSGENLPWAFFDIGKFSLLIGKPEESLIAYAKAVQLSTAEFMLETSLTSLNRIGALGADLPGSTWASRLLTLGRAVHFASEPALAELRELALGPVDAASGPVVIVAGSSDREVETETRAYLEPLIEAFGGLEALIVSGGTTRGVSALAGELQMRYPDTLHTIGYLPMVLPAEEMADEKRYSELRQTEGGDFSPLEPLQYWIDLVASDVDPSGVVLLAIGGGAISAIEYRIALALGARVGVIAESGREAEDVLRDRDWVTSRTLQVVQRSGNVIRAFLDGGS